jgi:predicted Rossmann-fold nucleotide-binding protein
MEALTLVQTGKTRRMPIILVGSKFWSGMLDWFRTALLEEKAISPEDMDLIQVIDEPKEVVNAIFKYYETRGFEPSAAEREKQLYL